MILGYIRAVLFIVTPTNHFRDYTCCFLKLNIVTVFSTIFYVSLTYFVFSFDLIFYKIIHPRRVTIIKCNQFVRNKIRKDVCYSFVKDKNFFVDSFVVK